MHQERAVLERRHECEEARSKTGGRHGNQIEANRTAAGARGGDLACEFLVNVLAQHRDDVDIAGWHREALRVASGDVDTTNGARQPAGIGLDHVSNDLVSPRTAGARTKSHDANSLPSDDRTGWTMA